MMPDPLGLDTTGISLPIATTGIRAGDSLPIGTTGIRAGKYTETQVVDPVRRDAWVYDGRETHDMGRARQHLLHEQAQRHATNVPPPHEESPNFDPSCSHIKAIGHEFTAATSGMSGWRGLERPGYDWRSDKHHIDPTAKDMWAASHSGAPYHNGMLPAISQLIKDDRLPYKSRGQIEAEMRQSDRLKDSRIFDRSGGRRP